jgi:hypothetical protein
VTYIATSPEREEEAREAMLRELERFTQEPVSDTELRQINYPGRAEESRQSGTAVAAEILEADCRYRVAELTDPGGGVRAVSAEDVLRQRGGPGPLRRAEESWRKGAARPPVAASVLSEGGCYCRLVRIAQSTPPAWAARSLVTLLVVPSLW